MGQPAGCAFLCGRHRPTPRLSLTPVSATKVSRWMLQANIFKATAPAGMQISMYLERGSFEFDLASRACSLRSRLASAQTPPQKLPQMPQPSERRLGCSSAQPRRPAHTWSCGCMARVRVLPKTHSTYLPDQHRAGVTCSTAGFTVGRASPQLGGPVFEPAVHTCGTWGRRRYSRPGLSSSCGPRVLTA